ncbi:MAG: YDG domain-containing protein [Bacillota bacterium]|nr:YDG domain-containing protein [Bacillota bacterium]
MVRKTKVRETASLIRNRGRTLVSILLIGVLAGASLLVALAGKPNGAAAAAKPEMITLLVKFRAGVSAQRAQEAVQGVAGEAHRTLDQIRTRVIKVPAAAAPAVMAALSKTAEVERVAAAVAVGAAGAPSDPEYGSQWALPAISWPDAYGAVPVTGSAKLFVLDTGVDGQHPDLASRVAGGMSFVEGNPLADPNGHRTALAGIAAAEVGNGAGIAGVAYCPVAVTSVQVLDSAGRGWDADVVPGILWAADQGADVILMGFSATTYSAALLDAVAYAQSRGTIVVAAAGNHGEVTTYPAALPGVVGVGAIDQQRAVLAGTSLGSSRVLAPGTGIYTTLPGGAYGSVGGASAAAAHAAGLAAMLKANGLGATTTAERLTGAVSPATGVSIGVIDVVKALTGNVGPTAPSEPTIPGPSGEPEYGIAAAPTIDTHPTDQTITYGVNATFTAVATGAKAPNARWQVSTNGGINWTDIAAVSPYGILTSKDTPADKKTTTTLTITKPPVSYSGYKYKVVFEHGGTTETNVATLTVTKATVTGSFTAANKVYDGGTAATIASRSLTGVIGGDDVSLSGGSATFSDKNVGVGKTVTGTGFGLAGADAGNYQLASTTLTTTASITKATVTGSFTADNKVYDGGTAATIASRSLTGVIGGDDVSLSGGSATFSDKNVGAGKTVTGTGFGLAGADAGNYQLASTTLTTTADITPRTLVVTYTGVNKVYDGNSNATVTTSDDRVAGDVLTINRTAAFTDKNVGNGKTVNVTGVSLAGTDAGNYSVAATGSATADITPRTLTVTYTGVNKVYDGTTAATVNTSDDRVLGDVLTITRTAAFTDKNVGAGKTVNVTGVSLSGADAGNYSVSATGSTTGSITPKLASVTPDPESKLWGTDDPTLTGTLSGFVTADGVTATYSRTTGEAIGEYTISATLSPAGELANYTITYNTAIFTITKRSTTLKYIGYTAQYSDPAGLSATLKDQTGTPVSGRTVLFTLGTQSISGVTDASGVAAPVLILTQAPGTSYTVTAAFAGDSLYLGSNSAPTSYTITREDARAEYTGALFVNTISATSGVATVPLRATIRDISAVLGDLAYDAYPGDILKANVTFYNGITKINATPLPLTLFDPADGKVAWAAYDWSVDIGSALSATYEITIKVNGYYVGELTGVLVTVSKPLGTEFITGGGYLTIGQSSAGTYAASAGSHMNFGFNVKYNKSGTKPQGSVNIIFRRSGKVYQIKTNSIQTLVVDPVTGKGTFYSKATLKDVTNPLIPIEVASNLRLDMRLTDGENVSGKKADTIGVALWTAEGKLLFSSNWSGTTTEEELLSGGNLVVH